MSAAGFSEDSKIDLFEKPLVDPLGLVSKDSKSDLLARTLPLPATGCSNVSLVSVTFIPGTSTGSLLTLVTCISVVGELSEIFVPAFFSVTYVSVVVVGELSKSSGVNVFSRALRADEPVGLR